MFWRFKDSGVGKDKFGRTYEEALKDHARWCVDTLRNNVPDEQAMQYVYDNSPTCLQCPPEFRVYFAGDAVFNAYTEIKACLEAFKPFYSPEEIAWITGWTKISKMNKLSYKIEIDEQPNFYPNIFKIVIDDKETDYFFDVAGLEISRSEGGVVPMFVCGCGVVMCTGYYVKIETLNDEVMWSKFYYTFFDYKNPEQNEEVEKVELIKNFDGKRADFIISPSLRFDKKEYNKMIDDILKEIPKHKEQQSEFESSLGGYKAGDRFHM